MHIKFTIAQKNGNDTVSRESEVKTDTPYSVDELAQAIIEKIVAVHASDGPICHLHVFVWD